MIKQLLLCTLVALCLALTLAEDQEFDDGKRMLPDGLAFGKRGGSRMPDGYRWGKRGDFDSMHFGFGKRMMPEGLAFGKKNDPFGTESMMHFGFGKKADVPVPLRFGKKAMPAGLAFGKKANFDDEGEKRQLPGQGQFRFG